MQSSSIRLPSLFAMAVFSIYTTSAAFAADPNDIDPARFEAQPVEYSDRWSGFYAGINVDVFAGLAEVGTGAGNPKFKNEEANGLLGAHLGYNFEPFGDYESGGWMFGVETDLSFGKFSNNKTDPNLGNVKTVGSFTASTRLRAGFAWEKLYLYGTAGLAASDYNIKPASTSGTEIGVGLVTGIGAEYAINDNWSVRADILAYDFGDRKYTFNGTQRKVDIQSVAFRLGATRRF